jgi:maltose O-acetyltransferase
MTAHSLVQDCLFVHEGKAKSRNSALADLHSEPVHIGNNVWLGGQTLILGGSSIGKDSVVSWGATCHRTVVKDYCLVSGNPAQRALPIPGVLRLTGSS